MFSLSAFNSELFLNAFDNADEKVSSLAFELIRRDPNNIIKIFFICFYILQILSDGYCLNEV